jgi:hypothetical protein
MTSPGLVAVEMEPVKLSQLCSQVRTAILNDPKVYSIQTAFCQMVQNDEKDSSLAHFNGSEHMYIRTEHVSLAVGTALARKIEAERMMRLLPSLTRLGDPFHEVTLDKRYVAGLLQTVRDFYWK